MAVVAKGRRTTKDTAGNATIKNDKFKISSHSSIRKQEAEEKGHCCSIGIEQKQRNDSRHACSVTSSDTKTHGPATQNADEQCNPQHLQAKKGERGDENVIKEALDSVSDQEEEVIGIITMEDVLEELLQEEILDETDECVDLHNKIKINMLASMKSSSSSPGAPSQMSRETPVASPLSSSHQTPVRSPLVRSTLSASPDKSVPNSPVGLAVPPRSSPSSHWVSRKSYEKLRKSSDS